MSKSLKEIASKGKFKFKLSFIFLSINFLPCGKASYTENQKTLIHIPALPVTNHFTIWASVFLSTK